MSKVYDTLAPAGGTGGIQGWRPPRPGRQIQRPSWIAAPMAGVPRIGRRALPGVGKRMESRTPVPTRPARLAARAAKPCNGRIVAPATRRGDRFRWRRDRDACYRGMVRSNSQLSGGPR